MPAPLSCSMSRSSNDTPANGNTIRGHNLEKILDAEALPDVIDKTSEYFSQNEEEINP